MSANFEIHDKKLVTMINESDHISSQESAEWEEMEHTDEIENWCSQVETADTIKKENIENPQEIHKTVENDESASPEQMDYDLESRQDMLDFVKNQRSENTKLKTQGDIRRFKEFLHKKGEKRRPVDIPPVTLDGYIGHFIMDLQKRDGSPYEPGTITGFHRYIYFV